MLDLQDTEVQQAVDSLMKKYLVSDRSAGYGGRVTKYKHRFCNTEFGSLKFSGQELGIICVLMLRGPQTPGELRSRTNRLCEFADAAEVESVLERLGSREDGPFVVRLGRAPGAREARYAHLFGGPVESMDDAVAVPPVPAATQIPGGIEARLRLLEEQVDALRAEVGALKSAQSSR